MDEYISDLRDLVSYDPITGAITWVKNRGRATAGARVEYRCSNGYLAFKANVGGRRRAFLAHRVGWALVHGRWPVEIDHIDRTTDNNAISNLREVSRNLNTARRRVMKRKLPRGVVDASHTNKTNPYMAQCGGKSIGYFSTPELAEEAYIAAHRNSYGEKEIPSG